jgi:hypothetical protein
MKPGHLMVSIAKNRRKKEESLHFVGIEPNKRVGEGELDQSFPGKPNGKLFSKRNSLFFPVHLPFRLRFLSCH